jgi:hypothetical protein
MAPTLLRNLARGASETVQIAAFAPKPIPDRIIPGSGVLTYRLPVA